MSAVVQLANTLIPFAILGWLIWFSLRWSYGITLALAIPQAGLLARIFVLHHDCCHRSFFTARWMNDGIGIALGMLTLTPFYRWRRDHILHHVTSGDLDRRGFGDITTLTVAEFKTLSPAKRAIYRIYRHPIFLFIIGPYIYFTIIQRLTVFVPKAWSRERINVWYTNAAILCGMWALAATIGWKEMFLIVIPVTAGTSTIGMWLFHVQHYYHQGYWRRRAEWDFGEAGLLGSSHYDLPQVLHWFTANIGVHHLHHLDSHVPNYRLQECLRENPGLAAKFRITIRQSFGCLTCALWDEDRQQMVSFREVS
jgi:omega-6 fatty acid desaturase (delta-12 desaturase)